MKQDGTEKILFCEGESGPICLRVFGRLSDMVKTDESMEKGAWQGKEQDARHARVDGGYTRAGGRKKKGGFFMVCISAETWGKSQA